MKILSTEEFNKGISDFSGEEKRYLLEVLNYFSNNSYNKIKKSPNVIQMNEDGLHSFIGNSLKVYFKVVDNKLFLINALVSGVDDNLTSYLKIMESIKGAIKEIEKSIRLGAPYSLMYGSLRLIMELISQSWIVLNPDFSSNKNLAYWNVNQVLKDMQKYNPNFYQQPVSVEGIKQTQIVNKECNYLTIDKFSNVYEICNSKIHYSDTSNKDVNDEELITTTLNEIVSLLDTHIIYPKERDTFYFIAMKGKDNKAFGNVFKKHNKAFKSDS
ncbi:hypothetical protein QRC94_004376 [Vibrio vulnificus]|nr:hypothetical protein [Vibrio vulnificus]EJC6821951.1 hypothetical protein [Vibrio vulnificus]EJC6955653.1 hypothetical protein [Vibrio vulnificus]EJC6960319.1 hypothetical protein [Vibrio vulnificus]EKQ3696646.1 hypothetical protein [Vibrio vulnificus]